MTEHTPFEGPLPAFATERLYLRAFCSTDAPSVRNLAGAREIARMTMTVPHPYEEGVAEEWISGHEPAWRDGERLTLAISTPGEGLVGAVGLHFAPEHERAELGYWIGTPFWGRGYATEASAALLAYGFEQLGLHRIVAHHFTRNPASGRVMRKIGMRHEGTLREHVLKWGAFEDLDCYGVLASEWRADMGGAEQGTRKHSKPVPTS